MCGGVCALQAHTCLSSASRSHGAARLRVLLSHRVPATAAALHGMQTCRHGGSSPQPTLPFSRSLGGERRTLCHHHSKGCTEPWSACSVVRASAYAPESCQFNFWSRASTDPRFPPHWVCAGGDKSMCLTSVFLFLSRPPPLKPMGKNPHSLVRIKKKKGLHQRRKGLRQAC